MPTPNELVVFTLDQHLYAVPLVVVERALRAVEVTPLPKAPDVVMGVVNVEGAVVPVMNLRKRFRLPERDITVDDQFILAATKRRTVLLVVDRVNGLIDFTDRGTFSADEIVSGLDYLSGVTKLSGEIVLIHDLDRFLSLQEEEALDTAMKERPEP